MVARKRRKRKPWSGADGSTTSSTRVRAFTSIKWKRESISHVRALRSRPGKAESREGVPPGSEEPGLPLHRGPPPRRRLPRLVIQRPSRGVRRCAHHVHAPLSAKVPVALEPTKKKNSSRSSYDIAGSF